MVSSFGHRRLITATMAAMVPFLLLSCSFIDTVRAQLLPVPTPKWSVQLQGSGPQSGRGLRKGNAIVADKDGTKIVVTANDGSLHIIQTTNQVKTLAVYVPDEKEGTTMECKSAATIVDGNQQDGLFYSTEGEEEIAKEDFIVYAVVDNAEDAPTFNENRGGTDKSRVIAVNRKGSLKWSVEVPGQIEGSPIVGKTGIYITHNLNDYGALSIIKIRPNDGMATVAATVSAYSEEEGTAIPLGPPALRTPPEWEDEEDSEDVVVVAENWDDGFSNTRGGMYMLASSDNTEEKKGKEEDNAPTTARSGEFELVKISNWSFSASAPPLVYGDSIFVGAAAGVVGGFTGNRKNDLSGILSGREDQIRPRWGYQVAPNMQNASQPLENQAVMDSEGQFLCFSGVNNDLYCLNSDNGQEAWRGFGFSQIVARPHIFEREDDWQKVVYAIESLNGRVHQFDFYSGRRFWDYSCTDFSDASCQDAVEADFAITPGGNAIYYGDIYGRINALEVATFETETPTAAPSSAPNMSPSGSPTITSVPTGTDVQAVLPGKLSDDIIINDGGSQQQGFNDQIDPIAAVEGAETSAIFNQQAARGDSNNMAAYIGTVVAGLCVLMIPIVIFSMLRKRRKKTASGDNVVVEIIDDYSSDDESLTDVFKTIEAENSYDPENGDGIEVTIINHVTPPRGNLTDKKKKQKKRKGNLPDTPNTVESPESTAEIPEDASAFVVVGEDDTVTDQSVEAVNLTGSFDQVASILTVASGIASIDDKATDASYFTDEDAPPPPPPNNGVSASQSSKKGRWGSLLRPSQASKKMTSSSEKIEPQQSTTPPQEESSTTMPTESPKDISIDEQPRVKKESKKMRWRKKSKKAIPPSSLEPEKDTTKADQAEIPTLPNEKDESESANDKKLKAESASEQTPADSNGSEETQESTEKVTEEVAEEVVQEPEKAITEEEHESEEPEIEIESSILPQEPPGSPSTYSEPSDAALQSLPPVRSLTPVQSVQSTLESAPDSPNHSSLKSVGSDDDSLYTSFTATMDEPSEKKEDAKDLSPLAEYVYDKYIHRRDRSEIINEGNYFLAQPALTTTLSGLEEHPDDERSMAPANQDLPDDVDGLKYGRSVRSKGGPNSFKSSNSSANEGRHTPISQMYDQLAALGQQRREEMKPGFKRRSKRMERENLTPPPQPPVQPPVQQQQGDTWGSFLDELAEAEQHFYSPSESKSKSLVNDSGTEDVQNAE